MKHYAKFFLVLTLLSVMVFNFLKRNVDNSLNVQMLTLLNIESLASGDIDGSQYPLSE